MQAKDTDAIRRPSAAAALLLSLALVPSFASAAAAAEAPKADSLARLVAERYGASEFHKVKALHYVFNARFAGKNIERRWIWFPRQDSVVYSGKDAAGLEVQAGYSRRNRFSMDSQGIRPIDKWFVNDQYWLLFPLHLVWDKGLRLEAADLSAAPDSGALVPAARGKSSGKRKGRGEAWRLTAAYPSEGGYTPGDAYDLFLDSMGTVKRWIFRKGNDPRPTREALWSDPVSVGPLKISMERPGPEDDFKLWFTGVKVESGP